MSCFPRKTEVLESTEPNRFRKAQLIEGSFFWIAKKQNAGNQFSFYSLSGILSATKHVVDDNSENGVFVDLYSLEI